MDQYENFCTASITEFEIRCGINKLQEGIWKELLTKIEVLPFDSLASQLAAQIDQTLKRKKKQIAIADLFIAAFATLNKKHFNRINMLNVIE